MCGRRIESHELVEHLILGIVSTEYAVGVDAIVSSGRTARVVLARQVAAWLLRRQLYTLEKIGDVLGGRDHSTVIHSLGVVDAARSSSAPYRERIDRLAAEVSAALVAAADPPSENSRAPAPEGSAASLNSPPAVSRGTEQERDTTTPSDAAP